MLLAITSVLLIFTLVPSRAATTLDSSATTMMPSSRDAASHARMGKMEVSSAGNWVGASRLAKLLLSRCIFLPCQNHHSVGLI